MDPHAKASVELASVIRGVIRRSSRKVQLRIIQTMFEWGFAESNVVPSNKTTASRLEDNAVGT